MRKKLLFVVNVDRFFLSHRLPIAKEALTRGYEVHVAAGATERAADIEKEGLVFHPLSLARGRAGLIDTLKSIVELGALFRRVKPDIAHLVTIKPVLFGGIAARILGVPHVVAAISGLGFVFLDRGVAANLRRWAVLFLYRLALGSKRAQVIFQNAEDRDSLIGSACIRAKQTIMIKGAGVDLTRFKAEPEREGTPVVILPARLLADKGVREFAQAAQLLRAKGHKARFCLVGEIDPANPASLTTDEIQLWARSGVVEIWGHRDDMPDVMAQAHIVALPSYREGMPKALLEAAACGRAIVTTDVPGCRDAIEPNKTGLLVPERDGPALAAGIESLLIEPERRRALGLAGRALAERCFDVKSVVRQHIDIYESGL